MADEIGLKYMLIKIPAIYPQYWLSQAVICKQTTNFSCCFSHVLGIFVVILSQNLDAVSHKHSVPVESKVKSHVSLKQI